MKYFLLLLFVGGICSVSFAQDSIVTTEGTQIRATVLQINKKDVLYKVYGDPEFTTYTLQEKEVHKIRLSNGKKYLFNHNLPRAFIGMNIGGFLPVGSFGRTDFEKREPGFALPGLGVDLQAGFYFTKRLGMHLSLGIHANTQDPEGYREYFSDSSNPDETVYVNYDEPNSRQYYESWGFVSGMFGPMYSFKPAKWLTVDTRLQFGFMNVRKPYLNVDVVDTVNTYNTFFLSNEESDWRPLPAYGGGLSFRFSPGRRIGFVFSADYIHTGGRLLFEETIETYSTSNSTRTDNLSRSVERTYNIDQIKLSIGLAYQFKRKNR